jgi:probable phosphoglycerate mutase
VSSIVLVRHGETAWSASGRHTSVTDVPLTDEGRAQAVGIGRALRGWTFQTVLTSPRSRAVQTAALAGLTAQVDPRLVEWDYGGYEGLTSAEISARTGTRWTVFADGVVPGNTPGETIDQVAARATAVLSALPSDGDAALVAHGHFLRVLAACWLRLPPADGALFALSAGSVSVLGYDHDCPALTLWNSPAA